MKTQQNVKILFVALILIAIMLFSLPASASIVESGDCGSDVHWTLDSSGKLTISGSGAMTGWLSVNETDQIKSVVVETGVTSIYNSSFTNCTNLSSVSLPNTLTRIGQSAFEGCSKLSSINIPSSVTYIGGYAFERCASLSAITISSSVRDLGDYVFYSCTNLTTATIQASTNNISFYSLFFDCPKLTAVSIPSDHRNYSSKDGVVFNKAGDELLYYPQGKSGSYAIPSGTKEIGYSAFENCKGLSSITFPNSVTHIHSYAFCSCTNLKSLTLTPYINSIDSYAFNNCGFKKVTLYKTLEYIGSEAFDRDVVITAPSNSEAARWAYENYNELVATAADYSVNILSITEHGTFTATPNHGPTGTVVTLSYSMKPGYKLAYWDVLEGSVTITNNKFTIGTNDVVIFACTEDASGNTYDSTSEIVALKKLKISKVSSPSKKKIKVEWKKLSSKDRKKIKYIQIQISTDKNFKNNVKTKKVKSSKTSCTVSGLKKKTKYYVRIRAYTKSGTIIYVSKWSSKKSIKTKKK